MSTQGYGDHPTIYQSLSDMELYAMYRRETWLPLDETHRQHLLQETVNRAAAQNGELGSCRVVFADLAPGVAGEQSGSEIRVSREMYALDQRSGTYGGRTVTRTLESSNLDALTTVLHEDQHAYQNQIIRGEIPAPDEALRQEYTANNYDMVLLRGQDGSVQPGYTYLRGSTPGETGYLMYYFQSTERDAHRFSEEKTVWIMSELEQRFGTEPSFQAYRQDLAVNGYDATMERGRELFQNENVEQEVNQSLMNHYYGTDKPVSPQIENLVSLEMAKTYNDLHQAAAQQLQSGQGAETAAQTAAPALAETASEAAPALAEAASETAPEIDTGVDLSGDSLDGGLE